MNVTALPTRELAVYSIMDASDYYIPFSGDDVFARDLGRGYAYVHGELGKTPITSFNEEAVGILQALLDRCRSHKWDKDDPNAMFPISEIPFRVHYDPDQWSDDAMVKGLFIVRRGATKVPTFDTLTLPQWWPEILCSPHLNSGGLVILSGSTGSGKSTLIYSTVVSRLMTFGGHARSIEKPVELKLSNWDVGSGLFVQTEPRPDLEYGAAMELALKQAMRSFPSIPSGKILMLGEVLTPQEASGALAAANSGHLVITTSHGSNVIDAVRRFVSAAGSERGGFGDIKRAREMMGGVLRAVFSQSLKVTPGFDGNRKYRTEGRVLLLRQASDVEKPGEVANIISDPSTDLISLNNPLVKQQEQMAAEAAAVGYERLTSAERRAAWMRLGQKMDILTGVK